MLLAGLTILDPATGPQPLPADGIRIREGRIAEVGRLEPQPGEDVFEGQGMVCLPGFVAAHVHLCQTLFRNEAENRPLLAWLRERIWPLEAAHDEQSLRVSARLGIAELLRGGVTAFQSMETAFGTEVVFEEVERTNLAALIGHALMDRPAPGLPRRLAPDFRSCLAETEDLRRRFDGRNEGRLRHAYAPRFLLSCTPSLLAEAAERAACARAFLHLHAAEHPAELDEVLAQTGKRTLPALDAYGLLGPRTGLAHCIQLDEAEVALMAERGAIALHCPSTNLKLGSGVARVVDLRAAGVRVLLGPDGAACNNRLDLWAELRLAALLAQWRSGPGSLRPIDLLRMATCEAARALGFEGCGTIRPGAWADLVLVDLDGSLTGPGGDLPTRLVYAAGRESVRHVLVAGRFALRDGQPTDPQLSPERLAAEADAAWRAVAGRSGI